MSQTKQSLLADYLSKDIYYIVDDLQHLRMRYEAGEMETLPLISFILYQNGFAQGFVMRHTKTAHQNTVTLEYSGSVTSVDLNRVSAFSIDNAEAFGHYFFSLPLTAIDKTVSKLEPSQTAARMEQALVKAGMEIKINIDQSFGGNGHQFWLYSQLITDVCMSIVEAAQQTVAKEALMEKAQNISIKTGEKLSMKSLGKTLEVTIPLTETMSTRSQRASLIEMLFETL